MRSPLRDLNSSGHDCSLCPGAELATREIQLCPSLCVALRLQAEFHAASRLHIFVDETQLFEQQRMRLLWKEIRQISPDGELTSSPQQLQKGRIDALYFRRFWIHADTTDMKSLDLVAENREAMRW
ncbi:hypothetical protein FHS27_002351 [Rhodopirellula rubra]|uniref:Uncharacterized protein n=1 Tax=Aporhodopirellula rubra TaxID=980271 RepID=A0A7W5H4M1_9BACT|nr:hypothetical protein [Aporhodopirellula rubra]MBB3206542.1 hypothetical protein [Aporhodopirellula rubra]